MTGLREQTRPTTVGELMTAPAIACREDSFFEEVAETLADHDISGLPVVSEDERVVGVISERDLAHALGSPMVRLAVRRHPHGGPPDRDLADLPREARRARDLMSQPALVCDEDTPVESVALMMTVNDINRVPVVKKDGRLVGVATRGDILRSLAGLPRLKPALHASTVIFGNESAVARPSIALGGS